ncbi:hypothetical protein CEB3_c13070 [Peptococcaceae bacterium CEB3]|nr:hypothetical protein CEB3_c13070 [Peptococcaceae bacterium CEB3]
MQLCLFFYATFRLRLSGTCLQVLVIFLPKFDLISRSVEALIGVVLPLMNPGIITALTSPAAYGFPTTYSSASKHPRILASFHCKDWNERTTPPLHEWDCESPLVDIYNNFDGIR